MHEILLYNSALEYNMVMQEKQFWSEKWPVLVGRREGNKASHQIKPDMKIFPCSTFPWLIAFEEVDAIVLNEIVIKFCVPGVNSNERVSACFFFFTCLNFQMSFVTCLSPSFVTQLKPCIRTSFWKYCKSSLNLRQKGKCVMLNLFWL